MDPPPQPSDAVRATVRALQVDRVAVDAARVLRGAGVPALLLKGAGTATLLYAGGPGRNYADVDLLVRREDLRAAGRALAAAGFACEHDDTSGGAAERVHPHSQVWRRPGATVEVDLHFGLPGTTASADHVWRVLHRDRTPLDLGDATVDVPSPAARALHVVLHAWQHRGRHARSLRDLDRALAVLDAATWDAVVALARELGAEDAVAAVLGPRDDAAALVARTRLRPGDATLPRLWMTDPPAGAIMLARLRDAPGARARARLVRELVLPPRVVLERATGERLSGRSAYLRAAAARLARAPRLLAPAVRATRPAPPPPTKDPR
ncbi:nucleotidyltransferase family protein [Patulibacter sp. SYSU D01012]|uniref:nucleotidyltransferase family protein n=1 Tax=Patulibacter sp. SYSU D01012 TaxID=2817381 RepID=UPI001B309390|nr:nucleotidyltransferase family protein [Patulibacter sp. SYSU D01012]